MNRLKYIVMVLMIGNFMVAFPPPWPSLPSAPLPSEPQRVIHPRRIIRVVNAVDQAIFGEPLRGPFGYNVRPRPVPGSVLWIFTDRMFAHAYGQFGQ